MSDRSSNGGCVGSFFGTLFALFVFVGLIWGVCFMEHIGREQNVIDGIAKRMDEIKRIPLEGLTEADLESQQAELTQIIALDSAVHRSQYDPLWFLNNSP